MFVFNQVRVRQSLIYQAIYIVKEELDSMSASPTSRLLFFLSLFEEFNSGRVATIRDGEIEFQG